MSRSALSRRTALALGVGAIGASRLGLDSAAGAKSTIDPVLFKRGINTFPWFSLTREYPAPRRDYAWPPFQLDRAIPTARDLARLARAGFDFVRIPVDPGPFLDAQGPHRALLYESLSAAVDEARKAGLGVIVNIQANEATHYYRSETLFATTTAPLLPAYRALVADVARRLAALGAVRVALEPVNEPPQGCGSADWDAVQLSILNAARNVAPTLTLIATGACGSMVSGLDALRPEPLASLHPLLFTFHFYEPYLFSHQGAPWMIEPVYRSLNAVPWPSAAGSLDATLAAVRVRMAEDTGRSRQQKRDAYAITERLIAEYFAANPARPFIDGYLDQIALWARRHRIAPDHVLMGEFGAVKTGGLIVAAKHADRIRYIRDVRESAEARGFGWAFWNLFDSMGLMDDASRVIDPDVIAALGLKMP